MNHFLKSMDRAALQTECPVCSIIAMTAVSSFDSLMNTQSTFSLFGIDKSLFLQNQPLIKVLY